MLRHLAAPLLIFLAACGTYSAPDQPPPDYSLRTPQMSTEYLRWSIANESAFHVYNCLSSDFRRKYDVKLSELDFFWSTAKERILEYVGGDFANVELTDQVIIDADTRLVTYESGEHRALVRFVREKEFSIDYISARRLGEGGRVATASEVLKVGDGQTVLTLPIEPSDADADDIYRVRYRAEWRIDDIVEHNLDAEANPRP